MKLNKKIIIFALSVGLLSHCNVAEAITNVTGYKSINNLSDSSYKTSEKSILNIVNRINRPSDFKEILNYSETRKVIDNNPELSYLVENNLLSYDVNIKYDRSDFYNPIKTSGVSRFDFTSNGDISKSDFLTTLSKSVYGVEESRYMVFSSKSIREINSSSEILHITSSYIPKGYSGSDDSFDFSRGDYNFYVSPNIYEMYYKTLVNKGVVSLSEFSDINFIDSMNSYSTIKEGKKVLPSWDSSLDYYNISSPNISNNSIIVKGSLPFGSGFKLEETSNSASLNSIEHSWFLDEKLLTLDALKYIEKALRLSEKEMTKTEAELINYKYGARYLDRLDEVSKDTVMFLVAKGILNFENDDEFKNLYKDLKGDFFRTLIYRIHNKDARFNFSSVQLTDNDNYWLSRGFYENKVNFFEGVGASFDTTVSEIKDESHSKKSISNLFGLIKRREITIASGETEFGVVRRFNNILNYTYKGEDLKSSTKPSGDIVSVELIGNILTVKFKVKAANSVAAVAIIDANMSVNYGKITSIGSVPAVSTVVNGNVTSTFVSQSALRKLSGFPIIVMNDKYLANKETGSRALLLEDNKIAIIGNEIVRTDNTIVEGINGEVYYNMDIISKLLSQSMLSSLDPSSVYILPTTSKEKKYTLLSSNGSELEKLYVQGIKVDPIITGSTADKMEKNFYNITLTNSISNLLIQNISKDIGASKNNYMIVEFNYVLPSTGALDVNDSYLDDVIEGNITMDDVYSNLYKRPSISSLSTLWDSNIAMSNALVNYMMGTSGVSYIKSGFIVPKVTILCDNGEPGNIYDINSINKFFLDKVKLSSTIVNNFGGYDTSKTFVQNYFSYVGMEDISSGDSILDSVKLKRTLEVIGYKKQVDTDLSYCDFSKFVVAGTGQIYRSLDSNPQLSVKGDKITITSKNSTAPKIVAGVSYTVDKNKSNLKDFIASKVTSSGIGDLVSLTPMEFIYDKDSTLSIKLINKDGSGHELNYIESLEGFRKDIFLDKTSFPVVDNNFSSNIDFINPTDEGIYFSEGKYYRIGADSKKVLLDESKKDDLKLLVKGPIKVYPKFQIMSTLYSPNPSNVLIKSNGDNLVLDVGNLVNSGISSQIIDSIVYENSDYIKYDDLPNNSIVYIGDISYRKVGEFLQSSILTNSDVISELSSTDLLSKAGEDAINTAVTKTIGAFSLYNKSVSSDIKFGGVEVPLGQYITGAKLGTGIEGSDYDRTLKLNDKGKAVINSFLSSDLYYSGSSFLSYCIAFKLDNSVRFRAIDDSNTKFSVIRVINKDSDGFLESIPYFMESLDYEETEGLNVDMLRSKFKPSDNAGELMEKFLDAYRWNTQRDIKELAKYWIRLICTVLSVNNLLTIVFRRSSIDVLVRDIKYSPSSKRNIDIYQIFTFGFQTVESSVPIWKGILVSGVLIAIASFATIGPI